ncbi:MAG: DUF2759 domain-containing protein [Bacilli bacterium]
MPTVILFFIVAVFSGIGSWNSWKDRNLLGLAFGVPSFLIFGWFAVMTLVDNGFPAQH